MPILDKQDIAKKKVRESILTACRLITCDCDLHVNAIVVIKTNNISDSELVIEIKESVLLENGSVSSEETQGEPKPQDVDITCNGLKKQTNDSSIKDITSNVAEKSTFNDLCDVEIENTNREITPTSHDSAFENLPNVCFPTPATSTETVSKTEQSFFKLNVCQKCNLTFNVFQDFVTHNYTTHFLHTCTFCCQTFTSRSNMLRHIRRHTGDKPFCCSICNLKFSRKDDHSIHVLKHSVAKPFVCGMCLKNYTDRSSLRSHMKKDHNKRLVYLCSQCGKGFGDPIEANKHRLVHSFARKNKLQCSMCSFTACSPDNLNKHMFSHVDDSKDKIMCQCDECNLTFNDFREYKKHVVTSLTPHKTLYCPLCHLTMDNVFIFMYHDCVNQQESHDTNLKAGDLTDLIPFSNVDNWYAKREHWCNECSVGFAIETDLQSHIQYHHGRLLDDTIAIYKKVPVIDLCSTGRVSRFTTNVSHSPHAITDVDSEKICDNGVIDLSMNSDKLQISGNNEDVCSNDETFIPECSDNVRSDTDNRLSQDYFRQFSKRLRAGSMTHYSFSSHNIKKRKCLSLPDENSESDSRSNSYQRSPSSFSDTQITVNNSPIYKADLTEVESKMTSLAMFKLQEIYRCDFCEEAFTNYRIFSNHCTSEHRRFLCDFCGMTFTSKPNRDRHRRYHTGEKPYSCHYCSCTFYRGDDLKYHLTTRHMSQQLTGSSKPKLQFA